MRILSNVTAAKAAKMAFSLIAAVFLLVVGMLLLITTPFFAAKLGVILTHASGRNVELSGNVHLHLLRRSPLIELEGVRVGNAEWSKNPQMFQADRIAFTLHPLALLRGRIVLPELVLEKPVLILEKNGQGQANWDFSQNPQAAVVKEPLPDNRYTIPVIHHLRIQGGQISYSDAKEHMNTELAIDTVQGDSGKDESLVLHGKGDLSKKPFTLEFTGASILQLRDSGEPYPFSLKTVLGDTSVEAEGTVEDPIKIENLDIILHLKGRNAADLFPLTGVVLPPTPPYSVEGHLKRRHAGAFYHFEDFKGQVGHSDISGDLKWHAARTPPYLEGHVESNTLDLKDLAGFIGADEAPEDTTRIIPDKPINLTRLAAMDADISFHGKHVKASELMHDFTMNVSVKDSVLALHPIAFKLAQGDISAQVEMNGKVNPPDVSVDATFKRLSLAALFKPLAERFGKDNVAAGYIGGKATIKGRGQSLREVLGGANGTLGIGMEGGKLSRLLLELIGLDIMRSAGLILTDSDEPVDLSCVVGDFQLEKGDLKVRNFLIDTEVTSLTAEGDANLRDETLNMDIRSHPKKPTLVSARSPIHIRGTFKKPSVGVDVPSLAARAGAATALALVAAPAAILAFINPGLGEDSHCATFIQRLQQNTGAAVPAQKK